MFSYLFERGSVRVSPAFPSRVIAEITLKRTDFIENGMMQMLWKAER
jgi:hypothetical protein